MDNKDEITSIGNKNKDEEIFKLRKLVSIFKNECKKLKEENDNLKKNERSESLEKKNESNVENSDGNVSEYGTDIQEKNEIIKRSIIEKSYKKLKDFTILLEDRLKNVKLESEKKCVELENKIEECNKNKKIYITEIGNLKEKLREQNSVIDGLNKKIEEYKIYLRSEKNVQACYENNIDQTIEYKIEIRKLKENIETLKKNNEITSKERQQYRSMIILCSQYKEKCKQIPNFQNKIDLLENQIKEMEIYKYKDNENIKKLTELKNTIINNQIENNNLKTQLNEWVNFAKIYINSKSINIDTLKKTMNELNNKYNEANSTKTDLEFKYRKIVVDIEVQKQLLEDKNFELKILKNKNMRLEKKYEFLKKDYLLEFTKNSTHISTTSILQNKNDEKGNEDNYKIEDIESVLPTNISSVLNEKYNEHDSEEIKKNKIENLLKLAQNYKYKIDFFQNDNLEKEKLIEELNNKIDKYKTDFENTQLKEKNIQVFTQDLLLYEKEINFLKEHAEIYKKQILNLENELANINNLWKEDNEKNEISIKNLKEALKKAQFEAKILANSSSSISGKNIIETKDTKNDSTFLYKDIDNMNSIDEIQIKNLKNENLYLKAKIEVIKIYYANQIKSFREAFLYILGWDIQIEQNDEEIFFIFTSMFSTHDGKFIFIKDKMQNDKRSYNKEKDEYEKFKRIKLEHDPTSDTSKIDPTSEKTKDEISYSTEQTSQCAVEKNLDTDEQFFAGLFGNKNQINAERIIDKINLKNTNINMSTIMKGCKYNLLLQGYYSIKWNENAEWKKYINKMTTYPILLSLLCIEEYNSIKSQYHNSLCKNSRSILFKI
ncbi:conserved Plasmodium protein, unknown function [Plasmodium berghei]|uniref:Uncharacterized protein n=2 Tax=Plasmodium berghei TaxID=5821 RepID=A0A509AF39_PLABA|nr:conserved Plasmodium protein, unknown function [Plasmodium berghei ANKA]CXI18112.1 conserved Plasmodium protein, unknown function [Plasmodium berghei]SCM19752.1 conserved Plasmodium protein, unknown function [Plasmodium berghei]SCN23487.1 conserved Plasmodium protein, unknown function [Plasmodium berghei]SCO59110.1 conserved Plasmodium protein, unknown function [Plasmodium berghei]SCO59798.1 conserved Plasmodium protein, unknown function [Plasmodium berghei]|eukprot:XP_034420623.1 conserved Plasmodium protein, unknown function [Plasmodium berghei ANKA]